MLRVENHVCAGEVDSAASSIQLNACVHVEGGWRPERHHASTGITREPLNSFTWRMLRGENCVRLGEVDSAAHPIQLNACLHIEGGWRPERNLASTGITREPLNSSTGGCWELKILSFPAKETVIYIQFKSMYVCTLKVDGDRNGITVQTQRGGIADF
jgi:hypothetical protein